MQWRGVTRSQILQHNGFQKTSHGHFRRYFASNPPISAQPSVDASPPTAPRPINKKVPLARHADLLATTGTKDDVSGIELRIAGLVRSIRKQKKVAFAHISDGSTLQPVQAILTPDLAKDINNGSFVELVGTWATSPAQGQANELQVTAMDYIGDTNPDEFPIQKKSMGVDFLRTVPHLRVRTPLHALLARARSRLIRHVSHYYNYVRLNEAFQVQPPLITSSDCEGAGEVFTINPKSTTPVPDMMQGQGEKENKLYFREPKYLTVSSQLHLEAYSAELGDVWTLSPTFRAEESDTPRHLSEFYMLEGEFRSITSLAALTKEVEDLVRYLVTSFQNDTVGRQLLTYYADHKYQSPDTEQAKVNLEERWYKVNGCSWTTLTYAEAISALESQTTTDFKFPPSWNSGLQLEHERWIVEQIGHNSPVFVTDYPRHIKPFYMLSSDASNDAATHHPSRNRSVEEMHVDTVACFDLLFPYGTAELVGGSLREHRLSYLISSMRDKGLIKRSSSRSDMKSNSVSTSKYPFLESDESLGSLQWYADLRRFGSSPHGGFGLGFDRLLAYLTGVLSIRDTVGFPRWFGRADC